MADVADAASVAGADQVAAVDVAASSNAEASGSAETLETAAAVGVDVGGSGGALEAPSAAGAKRPRSCVHFLKGRCRYGDACRYSHDAEQQVQRPTEKRAKTASSEYARAPVKPSLLQALLAKEIRAERSLLLQCVRKLVSVLDGEN